jgi:hypothetical protein
MTEIRRVVLTAVFIVSGLLADQGLLAQGGAGQTDTPYVATRLIWRWRGIMNQVLEDSRAFASEPVVDLMEVFVSPGAVRAVQDKLGEEQLKKADAVVERFALAVVAAAQRRDDGSRIVEEPAVDAAGKAICPVYPFCAD